MLHQYLNTTQYNVIWFKRAFENQELEIKPPFQRNPVWSLKQKSSLVDTILLGFPIPEIYMQEIVTEDGSQKHIIVDGQQRIRSVLSFISGEFELEDDSPNWQGMSFEDLTGEEKKRIYEYKFVIRQLPDMPDDEIRGIFQRLNKNVIALNPQELRHATYWGPFIKLMEQISDDDYWNSVNIFSANDRRRMLDTEFVSEITVSLLNGIQNKKKKLEDYYQAYETEFPEEGYVRHVFQTVLGELFQILPNIKDTRWKKKSDFYSLFLVLAKKHKEMPFDRSQRDLVRTRLIQFSEDVNRFIAEDYDSISEDKIEAISAYASNVERAASDLGSRRTRHEILRELLADVIGD